MNKKKWISLSFVVGAILVTFLYFERVQIQDVVREKTRTPLPLAIKYQETKEEPIPSPTVLTQKEVVPEKKVVPETKTPDLNDPVVEKKSLATEINLAVPFTSQAPTKDWSQPYQDACEEASVIMVAEFYAGNTASVISSDRAEKAILDIVASEDLLLGFSKDTTVSETAKFAEAFYKLASSEILENPTIDQIKEHLNRHEPVIVPAFGEALHNPYFVQPGPEYHMLVIRGYTKEGQFIVNDPGTKRGEAYLYSFETVMNAMHDWNKNGDITEGRKAILILHPKK